MTTILKAASVQYHSGAQGWPLEKILHFGHWMSNMMQNGIEKKMQNGHQNGHHNGVENGFHGKMMNGFQNGFENGVHNGVNGVHNGVNGVENGVNGVENGVNGVENGVNGVQNGSHNEQNDGEPTRFMELFNDVINPSKSKEEIAKAYEKWADHYDEVVIQYATGRMTTMGREFESMFKDKNIRILDVGAGTGLASAELRKRGFHNIDALDPSEAMIKKAMERNLYNNWYRAYLTKERLPIPSNQYDAGVGVGVFSDGQAREDSLEEILRILKPGGQFMVISGEHYMQQPYMANFEPRIRELEKEGKLVYKVRKVFPGYSLMDQGVINGLIIVIQKPHI